MFFPKLLAVASVAGLAIAPLGIAAQAAEVTAELTPANGAERSQPTLDSAPATPAEPSDTNEVTQALDCPPGQFASAFRDVYPFHWAYTAVNNLASERMQCFDLPEEFR